MIWLNWGTVFCFAVKLKFWADFQIKFSWLEEIKTLFGLH